MFSRYTNYGDLGIPAETTRIIGLYQHTYVAGLDVIRTKYLREICQHVIRSNEIKNKCERKVILCGCRSHE